MKKLQYVGRWIGVEEPAQSHLCTEEKISKMLILCRWGNHASSSYALFIALFCIFPIFQTFFFVAKIQTIVALTLNLHFRKEKKIRKKTYGTHCWFLTQGRLSTHIQFSPISHIPTKKAESSWNIENGSQQTSTSIRAKISSRLSPYVCSYTCQIRYPNICMIFRVAWAKSSENGEKNE